MVSSSVQFDRSSSVATSRPAEDSASQGIPLWLYPQILSLDAPAVSVAWQWLFAKSFHVAISPAVLFVTAACVWMIYAGDHLLDVHSGAIYSARHRFSQRHFRKFIAMIGIVFASATVASLRLSTTVWRGGLGLAAAVAFYLVLVHASGETVRRYWPKEVVVGVIFAAGSTIATWSSLQPLAALPIALFAALCILNCTAVEYWEWQRTHVLLRYPHRMTRWLTKHFYPAAVVISTASATAFIFTPSAVLIAVLLSAVLLILVARNRTRIAPEVSRLLADAALLTPLIFLFR